MDRYFRWHDMSEYIKIRFVVAQAGQYWKNVKKMMRYRRDDPCLYRLGRTEREA